jgi:hypothetical protein
MTNLYLERLRGRAEEKRHPPQPSKPSKPDFEGFVGDHGRHFFENETVVENAKRASHSYPQNLQNVRSPSASVCAVCNAADDLWHFGDAMVQAECARFLAKPEIAEPSAAYQTASPDCRVEIIELPQAERYRRPFGVLQLRPPALVEFKRWRQCVEDGKRFLAAWGSQAEASGWTSADLFGLHTPPERAHPSYRRLSRYDATGLVWLLEGREVIALTATTALIRKPHTGNITTYRRSNKPALGPLGDSLEDFK